MTAKEWWPLIVPVVLDWVWDKVQKRRESRARDEAVAVIRSSLQTMGEKGDKAVANIDKAMAELATNTSRWSKRWTEPPPPNGDPKP